MGIVLGFFFGFHVALYSGLIAGTCFGAVMSLVLGTLHIWSTRHSAMGGNGGPNQSIELEMDPPIALVFDRCVRALEQFGAEIGTQQRNDGVIEATTGLTWKSWGEVLCVHVKDHEHEKVKVQISSSPRVETTLLDYGKGRENVEKIAGFLTEDNWSRTPEKGQV